MDSAVETRRLREEIERALCGAFDPADVLPRLARLARLAGPASDDGIFAHRQLAELLVERHPWRAALYARRALAHRPSDDRAWAVLAFCQTLLGNFRSAAAAYQQAIASAPGNPWYAHNLGHLLDVALGAPARALPWLASAYGKKSDNSEIVASYVHALARAGRMSEAREVLERALGRFDSRELEALLRWVDQGAPSRETGPSTGKRRRRRASPADASAARPAPQASAADAPAAGAGRRDQRLARVLARGLSHLPLDPGQRKRALLLARDALASHDDTSASEPPPAGIPAPAPSCTELRGATARRDARDVAGLAAAVAYAIVYVDHVPLSQAEVAAPFRVAVARLRGRFAELRAKLDIIPGDARYATTRA